MKLTYAPQAGLRRRRPDQRREKLAFWAGLLIVAAFELVLMSKSWSPATTARIFDFHNEAEAEAAPLPDAPN
jgi:hypothetical protein